MKKSILITICILAIALNGCTKGKKDNAEKPKPKAQLVKIEELKFSTISKSIKLIGSVEAKIISNVVAPVDGYIEKLNVRENDYVKKDKEIAIIGTQERTSLISQTKNNLEELKSRLGKALPNSAEHIQLSAQYEQAKKELQYADKLFLGIPVICPLSGTVTQKYVEAGSTVSAKQNLITIVDFHSIIIKTSVSEELFSKIKTGDKLSAKFNAVPQKIFTAKVSLKYQQIDPATRNFPVELKIVSSTKEITPGMMVELEFITDKKERTLTVSNDVFIVNQKGEKIVYVVKDSVVQQKIVTTGISNEKATEVISGLNEGEKLVVMGQELLKDGVKVMVQKPKSAKIELKNRTEPKKESGKKK